MHHNDVDDLVWLWQSSLLKLGKDQFVIHEYFKSANLIAGLKMDVLIG